MDILKLAEIYQKLAQQPPPMPTGTTDPSKLPAGAYTEPSGEVTIVGDPKAQKGQSGSGAQGDSNTMVIRQTPQSPQQLMQQSGWTNFKVHSYYYPPKLEDRKLLESKGYKLMKLPPNSLGMVPPNEVAFVNQALAKGWKYAGPGFGLLPPKWYNWVRQQGYIK